MSNMKKYMKHVLQKVMLYLCSLINSLQFHEKKYFVENAPSIVKESNLIVSIFLGHPVNIKYKKLLSKWSKTHSLSLTIINPAFVQQWLSFDVYKQQNYPFFSLGRGTLFSSMFKLAKFFSVTTSSSFDNTLEENEGSWWKLCLVSCKYGGKSLLVKKLKVFFSWKCRVKSRLAVKVVLNWRTVTKSGWCKRNRKRKTKKWWLPATTTKFQP